MSQGLLDAIDKLVLSNNFYKWLCSEGSELAQPNDVLRRAFHRIHPREAFCDVLSGEDFEWPPGVSHVAYGPSYVTPHYRH